MFLNKKIIIIFLLLLSMFILIGIYYNQIKFLFVEHEILDIRSEKGEVKILPTEPGGIAFPGVDLKIYSVVNEKEKILPTNNVTSEFKDTEIKYKNDEYFIQLASFASEEQAREFKKKLSTIKNIELKYSISLIDIKDKGIFYRVLGGPFENKKIASKVCESFSKNNMDCYVIK